MSSDDSRRAIGKITSVAADRFIVELHRGNDNFTVVGFDDIHYVARLGSFVIIPVQSDYVVAEVVGLWEKDPTSGRPDKESSRELDKASSAKYLELVPVGTLPKKCEESFRFGVSTFPSLYADALYALDDELDRIFEVANPLEKIGSSDNTRLRSLTIGSSVIFQGYDVKVRIDEYFGGHVAVLGNTGSGKSCTVASVLQSLFEKKTEFLARGATFIILDVNGEYRQAFSELPDGIKRSYLQIATNPDDPAPEPLDEHESTAIFRLPHWFMSEEEWELLLRASERTQQPILRSALGLTSLLKNTGNTEAREHIVAQCILECFRGAEGDSPVAKAQRVIAILNKFGTTRLNANILRDNNFNFRFCNFDNGQDSENFLNALRAFVREDIVIPTYRGEEFDFDTLEDCFEMALLYEEAHGNRQIRDYCAQLLTRFKAISRKEEFAFLRVPTASLRTEEKKLDLFIEQFIGLRREDEHLKKTAQIIILDMNEAADEVVEVASAVMARLIFDRLRKADPRNCLPVHLILEEAHRYVAEKPTRHAIDASRIFERIAKEGRKYGMFLQVASQRPSELSKTVLSQCSNFVIHRIQNPDDLSHIRQMTPFISESVMKRLPSLPKQHALIFGNAVNLPTTFKVRDVNPRPKSDDAAIRKLWFKADNEPTELKFVRVQENEAVTPTVQTPAVTVAAPPSPVQTADGLDDEIPF